MIRIKSIYDYNENMACIKLRHKHSCTLEVLSVIYRLIDEIVDNTDTTRKEVYKLLKEMEKENANKRK